MGPPLDRGARRGEHNLTDPLVTTPWDDDQRLRDEAVVETATADGLPAGFSPADLPDLDFADDARAAALDLSLADGRFAPDVLEASARRAVAAWAEAVDGDDRPSPSSQPSRRSGSSCTRGMRAGSNVCRQGTPRRAIRAPSAGRRFGARHDDGRDRTGRKRYVQDRDTAAVVSGSRDEAVTFTERWTLGLDGDGTTPWKIVSANVTDGAPAP